ncbi:prepilin-type N-terminal cleavage/methylation domain-containing protein [Massilia sp. G4R7]|uniref:Prepilin-type N-terminal cleavage/methylation domain-containing protein n=1 Tax=Massilia phyllostachyos TaxID=2898585 RepID=A0ABS8QC07_9BURK|nr:prepilin-type N-terminal cleavage/methylation domain-containing protein [Massilia phyllostachyos]MCD2519300.1 prepilin-type N-terminal cleavage/methylation domain-containing protein [Massilia phyllostachyos]
MKRNNGFTLVELLVAISILAILAVLGWRGLDGIVRARIALTEQMEVTRGMQLAFAQMQSDCEHLAPRSLLGNRTNLLWEEDRLTLVRKVYNENQPTQLVVVSYRVANGNLVRRESRGTRDLAQLDALWQAVASDAPSESATPVVLQGRVAAMGIQVWQGNAWRTEAMPATEGGQPVEPDGIQISLTSTGLAAPMVKSLLLGGT